MDTFAVTENGPVQYVSRPTATHRRKKKLRARQILAAVVILVLAMAVISVPKIIEQRKIKSYNLGAEYLEKGDYRKADEIFTALGDYEDAPVAAAYARKGIVYTEAKDAMASGEYELAAESFSSLGGFKDADALAAECAQIMALRKGEELFRAGSYADAIEELIRADGYGNSPELMEQCRLSLAAQEIEEAMEQKDYDRALSLLDGEYGLLLEDREEKLSHCRNGQKYLQAEEAYNDGLYYTAHKLFGELGSFGDAADRARECVIDRPRVGETYHNSQYNKKGCTLTIKLNNSAETYVYLKIYLVSGSEEILVSCVFLSGGSSVTVSLPSGTFVLKTATGKGSWYGEKEMFGDSGSYQRLLYNSKSDRFPLEKNGEYILTLNTSSNGNVGSKKESMATF